MTTATYFDEARKAQENLDPLLTEALQDARDRLEKAKESAADPRHSEMIKAIEEAPKLSTGEAIQVFADHRSEGPTHSRRDGRHLIGRVRALVSANEYDFTMAQKVSKSLYMALRGDIETGLVKFPQVDHWSYAFDRSQLDNFAYWIAPEKYEEIQEAKRKAQEEKERAEREVEALETAAESLNNLIPEVKEDATADDH